MMCVPRGCDSNGQSLRRKTNGKADAVHEPEPEPKPQPEPEIDSEAAARRRRIEGNSCGDYLYAAIMLFFVIAMSFSLAVLWWAWLQNQMTVANSMNPVEWLTNGWNPFSYYSGKTTWNESDEKGAIHQSSLCITLGITLVCIGLLQRMLPEDVIPLVWLFIGLPLKIIGGIGVFLCIVGGTLVSMEDGKEFATPGDWEIPEELKTVEKVIGAMGI